MTRTARCTIWLVMVNVAVYLVMFGCWILSGQNPGAVNSLSDMLALPSSPEAVVRHPWTLLTFMFTQVGVIHLFANMLWLIGFGGMIKCAPRGLVATYIAGGILGAVGYLTYSSMFATAPSPLIGASASVMAVVVATTILTPDRHVGLLWFWEVKLKWLAPVALLTIFDGSPGAVAAHLGGVAGGLGCGLLLRYLDRLHSERSLRKARQEVARLKREARRSAILAKAGTSGFASLSEAERLEVFNLSRRASGE